MKKFNLRRFEEGGNSSNAGNGNGNQGNAGVTYNIEQVNQIVADRTNRATQSALRSYFQQQGMTQEQAEQAMNDYKQKQAQNNPAKRVLELEKQLAAERAENQANKNKTVLTGLNVSADFADYVAFEVQKLVTDKKDFAAAAAEYAKAHPNYFGCGYRMSSGISGSSGSGATNNESINRMIRAAAGRR